MTGPLELGLEGATRLAVLGVGSELRSDDVAGLLAVRALARAFEGRDDLLALEGSSAPENFTGPIIRFRPSHLVIVDCAELGEAPGAARLFPRADIGGFSSSTHSLPLSVLLDYIERGWPCEIAIVGIQPASLAFDGEPSREAAAAARRVAAALIGAARAMEARA